MNRKFLAVLRALGAFALTLLLVVGVPALLVIAVGNPFPSSIPSVDEIRILLTQNGQGFSNFLIGTLAVLIWFIWAQLVVALVVEIVATIRNAETRRLPTAPGIQTLAARLIATMALATTLATAPVLAPAIGALNLDGYAPVAASSVQVDMDSHGIVAPPRAGPAGDFAAAEQVQESTALVLAEQTELWDLAEAAYGDGVSWKLIAQANAGSTDAAGTMITDETEVLAAGTHLQLTGTIDAALVQNFGELERDGADAEAFEARVGSVAPEATDRVGEHPSASANADADAHHVVEPGDSMWSLAEHVVETEQGAPASDAEVAEYWVDVVAANQDVASGDVDLIYPGEELTLPGAASLLQGDTAQPAVGLANAEAGQVAETVDTPQVDESPLDASSDPLPNPHPAPNPANAPTVEAPAPAAAGSVVTSTAVSPAASDQGRDIPLRHVALTGVRHGNAVRRNHRRGSPAP